MKANDKENIALESARKRQINPARGFFFEERMPRCRHNTHYFDRLLLLASVIQIGASSNVAAIF